MKRLILALLLAIPCVAQMQVALDPATTTVGFTLQDPLHTVHGTFKLKRGTIQFDPVSGMASGELAVDAASGDSGSKGRDSRMNKNILESNKYPEIVFKPDRVEGKVALDGDSEVKLHGTFSIHGADHEVNMAVKTHFNGSKLTAEITFPVPYVKWGMKNPSTFVLRVHDTVDIEIHATATIAK